MQIPKNSRVRPSLEYLHQYTVKRVTKITGGFTIHFENGSKVEVHDPLAKDPGPLAKLTLISTLFEKDKTTMRFGNVKRVLNVPQVTGEILVSVKPDSYKITDPRFEEAAWPQRSEK